MNCDLGMHRAKNVGTSSVLSNIIKDTSTIMCNPLSEYVWEGYA